MGKKTKISMGAVTRTYALTGQNNTLVTGVLMSAVTGSYSFTPQVFTAQQAAFPVFVADMTPYALTGQDVELPLSPLMNAVQASYTETGSDITAQAVDAPVMTAVFATFSFNGQDVTLTDSASTTMDADYGSYAWDLIPVTMTDAGPGPAPGTTSSTPFGIGKLGAIAR